MGRTKGNLSVLLATCGMSIVYKRMNKKQKKITQ